MTVQTRCGCDGFTMGQVADILIGIEHRTVEEACQYLIELGYSDTFYADERPYTIENYLGIARTLGIQDQMAEDIQGITFLGGPRGDEWLVLSLQCLLEDHVAQAICVFGGEIVARSLGIEITKGL